MEIESSMNLFADDTSLLEPILDVLEYEQRINRDLDRLTKWASQWLVTFNPPKTVHLLVSFKKHTVYPNIYLNGIPVERVRSHKHLGIILHEKCKWMSMLILSVPKQTGHHLCYLEPKIILTDLA